MAQRLDATSLTIPRWVQESGWSEMGQDEMSRSFLRALDPGGMVWEGQEHSPRRSGPVRLDRRPSSTRYSTIRSARSTTLRGRTSPIVLAVVRLSVRVNCCGV
jgi:hypothetical protein